MADADGEPGATPAETAAVGEFGSWRDLALSFVAFLLLLGQPVTVFALAVTSPSTGTLLVIAGGTVLLAAPLARVFVRQGRSTDRLGDFVLVAAAVQVVAWVASGLVASGTDGPSVALVKPTLVVGSYPVAYYVVYRGRPPSPFRFG